MDLHTIYQPEISSRRKYTHLEAAGAIETLATILAFIFGGQKFFTEFLVLRLLHAHQHMLRVRLSRCNWAATACRRRSRRARADAAVVRVVIQRLGWSEYGARGGPGCHIRVSRSLMVNISVWSLGSVRNFVWLVQRMDSRARGAWNWVSRRLRVWAGQDTGL